jgi:hypothetical protein
MNQLREAHHSARPLHSPEGATSRGGWVRTATPLAALQAPACWVHSPGSAPTGERQGCNVLESRRQSSVVRVAADGVGAEEQGTPLGRGGCGCLRATVVDYRVLLLTASSAAWPRSPAFGWSCGRRRRPRRQCRSRPLKDRRGPLDLSCCVTPPTRRRRGLGAGLSCHCRPAVGSPGWPTGCIVGRSAVSQHAPAPSGHRRDPSSTSTVDVDATPATATDSCRPTLPPRCGRGVPLGGGKP